MGAIGRSHSTARECRTRRYPPAWNDYTEHLSKYLGYHSSISQLYASDIRCANEQDHVRSVHELLGETGVLKIKLGFEDDESKYMQQLILSLHKHHGHGLPITHSASRGWFWDVRPLPGQNQQAASKPARSETARDFPWHTDCSYEHLPPRFFALQVLQPDRCGGGTLSILDADKIAGLLSPATRRSLSRPEYRITVPAEFIKSDERHITAPLLSKDSGSGAAELRFREEILEPLTNGAKLALQEFGESLQSPNAKAATLHLTPELLPRGSIILINNRRWLHARSEVKDPRRHLRRVRWDARPFAAEEALGL
ncbi:uncharacterized protein CIMG_09565 [Coccidioides immitis RS]|uniref:TauD/TfdA-like domain-containing protein n=1 Tax=Coccidioides immitis (strain RS) TaxID=246410 RepID=A0A0E1RW31_COCIM|nr:uncharacterized protein CIMG_09565 [Coccidioides immitis RS]EAS28361.2 hypothetical protein CIMG_09565 [Coccidioides immitis RS]